MFLFLIPQKSMSGVLFEFAPLEGLPGTHAGVTTSLPPYWGLKLS